MTVGRGLAPAATYTTGALGTATDTVSYSYGNAQWGDLLTSYDGSSIQYDAMGNPLHDGHWTYEWEHGRQLASMTETAQLPITVTAQPQNYTGEVDGYAVFCVTAQGEGLTYQWQYSIDRGTSWYSSSSAIQGYNTDTLTIQATNARSGFLYRCKITDEDGNILYSDRAQIDLGGNYALAILTQPHTFTGVYGETAMFTASADGEDLTYQWQFKNGNSGAWWDSTMAGSDTTSISVQFTPAREAYLYRCKVTDGEGNIRYTKGAGFFLDEHTWQYTYQTEGLRTGRTDGKTTYRYIYNGSQLTQMTVGSNTLSFAYDANGKPLTVILNGTVYYYTTNLQGDVTGIWDASGNRVATYTYDAWGNVTVESDDPIAAYNPLTYRGYIYDAETELYYLQSRYYDSEVGRFINADGLVTTGQGMLGNNMFAYCLNNPVNKVDFAGNKPGDLFNSMDEAALDFAMCYNQKSIEDKQEYGSAIYMVIKPNIIYPKTPLWMTLLGLKKKPIVVSVSVYYSYTEPAIGTNGNSVLPNLLTSFPIVSTVHSHGNYDPRYDNENFSRGWFSDIGWSNFFKMDSYLVTPGGYLKKYTYKNRNDENGGVTEISDDIPWAPNCPYR